MRFAKLLGLTLSLIFVIQVPKRGSVRLPIQALSPFTGEPVDLATASHGSTIFTYLCPSTGKEFDVVQYGSVCRLTNRSNLHRAA